MSAKEMIRSAAQQESVLALYPTEQINMLRNQIAPGFTDAELAYGLTVARARNLDPFQKQVYFSKRRSRVGDNWVEKVEVEPTIAGLESIADRTGELDGEDPPLWCGVDGVWHDVWLDDRSPPAAAKFTLYRKGRSKPFYAVALFVEYCQRNKEGKPTQMWAKMPANQLLKCAEAKALRKAFPTELGGLYTKEEMEQADNPSRFDSLPQESRELDVTPAARVVTIEPKQPQATKKGEALPPVPDFIDTIPASIVLAIKPLVGLEGIPLKQMADDDLDLVREHMRKAREIWRVTAKSQRALDWLDAIAMTADALLVERNGGGIPPAEVES